MSDHDIELLEQMLDERVHDVRPDLAARARHGVRVGTRLRRRRRVLGALTASAAVVAVVGAGAQLSGSPGSAPPAPGVATDPSSVPSTPVPSPSALPSERRCRKAFAVTGKHLVLSPPSPRVSEDTKAAKERLGRQYTRLTHTLPPTVACKAGLARTRLHLTGSVPEALPVTLVAPGWTCTDPGDEKFVCAHGPDSVVVTVRPATEHAAYLHDPDKTSPDQFVSDVHGKVFATVVRAPGERSVSVDSLGSQLVWH